MGPHARTTPTVSRRSPALSLGTWATPRFLRSVGTRSLYTTWTVDNIAKPAVYQLMGGPPVLWQSLDEQRCRLTILIGTNLVVSHGHDSAVPDPIHRLRQLRTQGEVWVIDPRATETARQASRHLAIRPGTDHVHLAHLVREVLREGADADAIAHHTLKSMR